MAEHISINEAIRTGVTKLRLDRWACPEDHIEIYIADQVKGWSGPWVKLWSPTNELIGQKNPQEMLITMIGDLDDKCWSPYLDLDTAIESDSGIENRQDDGYSRFVAWRAKKEVNKK